jgi:hypothetical protein
MDAREIKLLKQVCQNLDRSTRTTWTAGDLAKWSEYANKMKSAINDSIGIIGTLTDDDPTNDLTAEDLIAKNLKA